jgi:hypothetical protein
MPRTIRVSVREDVTERQTLDFEIPDELDVNDTDALQEYFEEAFIEGSYREVPNTKDLAIEERVFYDPEILTQGKTA